MYGGIVRWAFGFLCLLLIHPMYELIVLMVVSASIAWVLTGLVIRFAPKLKLVHEPNDRSSHHQLIPHGGGISIVISTVCFTMWLIFRDEERHIAYWASVGLSLIVAAKGLIDDIIHLSAILRLIIQTLVSSALILTLYTLPIDGLEPINVLPMWLSLMVVSFAVVWWLNLFNFMDGVDGLAGSQAVFMLGGAACLIFIVHPSASSTTVWAWMVCLSAATFGFLLYNWSPAQIFLGDIGSLFLAFMIMFLALLTISLHWMNYASWIILAALFVVDATVTLLRRIVIGENWMTAHRSHAYQNLSRHWKSHRKVTLLFISVNSFWLFPLAYLSLIFPLESIWFAIMAYAPLIFIAHKLKAGVPNCDHG